MERDREPGNADEAEEEEYVLSEYDDGISLDDAFEYVLEEPIEASEEEVGKVRSEEEEEEDAKMSGWIAINLTVLSKGLIWK
jgi:hypothetical protein